jgi:enolase-phosphatase E1
MTHQASTPEAAAEEFGAELSHLTLDADVSHVLLDIEGTTCPVSFVADTLFPYARARLGSFLHEHGQDSDLQPLLSALNEAWRNDCHNVDGEDIETNETPNLHQLSSFLRRLIDEDRKLTALKDLQGLIWKEGYRSGSLLAPLFADVAPALKRWYAAGLRLAVYSSGSIAAQQLLYGHSTAGDLHQLFCGWFDTRIGRKQDPASYLKIAESLSTPPARILFVSDSLAELDAAHSSGLAVIFSNRPGNPEEDPGIHPQLASLEQIELPA